MKRRETSLTSIIGVAVGIPAAISLPLPVVSPYLWREYTWRFLSVNCAIGDAARLRVGRARAMLYSVPPEPGRAPGYQCDGLTGQRTSENISHLFIPRS